jgi:MYXO-CTERM domain-containing protein
MGEFTMSKQLKTKPLAAAVSAALATTVATLPSANAEVSPFSMTTLSSGYMVASAGEGSCGEDKKTEGSCGEGSCGEDKKAEGSCGEGSCGADKEGEGSCGGDKKAEGSCGEGSCGGDKKAEGSCGEGSCGADKEGEGSCGGDKGAEGSCGADKEAAAEAIVEEAMATESSGSGSAGVFSLLGLLSAIGLRRRIKRS